MKSRESAVLIALWVTLAMAVLLSGCSVYMAAKKEGVRLEDLCQCKTRGCVLSKGAVPISSEKAEEGGVVDVYIVQAPKGSAARAVMHGVLDVFTLGIWEVAGTPIEGSLGKKRQYAIRVTYDNEDNVKKVEMVQ